MDRRVLFCSTLLASVQLAACGGGEAPSSYTPPPMQPPSVPPPATGPSATNYDTDEYRHSNAAILSNAMPAWQQGATGRGVKIGFVDSGLNLTNPEFANKVDPASRDVAGDRPMSDIEGHGTAVAAIAAAARNDYGLQGVAFDATIVMMKADKPGTCPGDCKYSDADTAQAIDSARAAGAKVISISITGDADGDVRSAIQRAASSGIVIVVAAGNDSDSEPGLYARQLATAAPGNVIIVGALGLNTGSTIDYNRLATFSDRAGGYAATYLGAPGYLVNVSGLNGGIDNFSGTSFAAPVVAGAAALLTQAFPNLSARQIVEILLMTADDLGLGGADSIFGRGRLNIGNAFQPIGATMLAGASTIVSTVSSGAMPAAAGDAGQNGSLNAVVLDSYERAFKVNLAGTVRRAGTARPLERAIVGSVKSGAFGLGPATVAMSVYDPRSLEAGDRLTSLTMRPEEAQSARLLAMSAVTRLGSRASIAFGISHGSKSLERRLADAESAAFMVNSDVTAEPGFATRRGIAFAFRNDLGPVNLTFSGETGDVLKIYADDVRAPYRQASIIIDRRFDHTYLSLGVSHLAEEQTVLGGRLGPAFGQPGAKSFFLDAQASRQLGEGWSARAGLRRGMTMFASGFMRTSAYSFELAKSGLRQENGTLTLRLSQPLRVEKGGFSMLLPTSYEYQSKSTIHSRSRLSLAPTSRELVAEAGYEVNLAAGQYGFNLFARRHPGHSRRAAADIGGALHFETKF